MTMSRPLGLRVFVSSPGDVGDERQAALAVLAGLPEALGAQDRLTIEPVLWDDPRAPVPLEMGRSGQASVDAYKPRTSQCDLVVVILSSRFGSPALLEDGSELDSGTAYEINEALAAGVPVWVYRDQRPLQIPPSLPAQEQQRRLDQFQRVQHFFDTRFSDVNGRRTGEFNAYADAPAFADLLGKHLRMLAQQRLALHDKPYCVPETGSELPITGRDTELALLRTRVQAGQHTCLLRSPGVGKTALAHALVDDRTAILRTFAGVLWLEFGKRPELQPQLREWAWALGIEEAQHATLATEDDWLRAIQQRIGTRRMLIVLDDVWTPEQVSGLMAQLPDSVFVVTTRRTNEVAENLEWGNDDPYIQLDDLNEADSLRLLGLCAPEAMRLAPQRVRELVQRVGGLPQALKLIGKYLRKKSLMGSKDVLERALDELHRPDILMELRAPVPAHHAGGTQTLDALIDLSYRALERDATRETFLGLAVFRPKPYYFTAEMAAEICALPDVVGDLEALWDLGMIECRRNDDDPAKPSEYTLHPIVHGFAQRRLPTERKAALQNRLLDWYARRIDVSAQRGVTDQYALWYRYEHAHWHADVGNWLYYLAVGSDASASMVAFLRVYFDAWWWWGFFQEFRFCQKLVDEWAQRSVGPTQRAGLAMLQTFQQSFPRGMGPRGKRADWRRAQAALQQMLNGLQADTAIDAKRPEDAARVRAALHFALAECAAYGDGDKAKALTLLDGALAALASLNDPWTRAYLHGYQAQYLVEAGRADEALACLSQGLTLAEALHDDPDPELLANLWHARGEALRLRGEFDASRQAWCRAAALALAFQALPEAADAYTVNYFEHLAGHFSRLVLGLHDQDPKVARAYARDMQDLWQPWWQRHTQGAVTGVDGPITARDPGALRAALFPPMVATDADTQLIHLAGQVDELIDRILDLADLAALSRALRAAQGRRAAE